MESYVNVTADEGFSFERTDSGRSYSISPIGVNRHSLESTPQPMRTNPTTPFVQTKNDHFETIYDSAKNDVTSEVITSPVVCSTTLPRNQMVDIHIPRKVEVLREKPPSAPVALTPTSVVNCVVRFKDNTTVNGKAGVCVVAVPDSIQPIEACSFMETLDRFSDPINSPVIVADNSVPDVEKNTTTDSNDSVCNDSISSENPFTFLNPILSVSKKGKITKETSEKINVEKISSMKNETRNTVILDDEVAVHSVPTTVVHRISSNQPINLCEENDIPPIDSNYRKSVKNSKCSENEKTDSFQQTSCNSANNSSMCEDSRVNQMLFEKGWKMSVEGPMKNNHKYQRFASDYVDTTKKSSVAQSKTIFSENGISNNHKKEYNSNNKKGINFVGASARTKSQKRKLNSGTSANDAICLSDDDVIAYSKSFLGTQGYVRKPNTKIGTSKRIKTNIKISSPAATMGMFAGYSENKTYTKRNFAKKPKCVPVMRRRPHERDVQYIPNPAKREPPKPKPNIFPQLASRIAKSFFQGRCVTANHNPSAITSDQDILQWQCNLTHNFKASIAKMVRTRSCPVCRNATNAYDREAQWRNTARNTQAELFEEAKRKMKSQWNTYHQSEQNKQKGNSNQRYTSKQDKKRLDALKVLGLRNFRATQQEIKARYKLLAKQFHPDKNKSPGAEETFKRISTAYAYFK